LPRYTWFLPDNQSTCFARSFRPTHAIISDWLKDLTNTTLTLIPLPKRNIWSNSCLRILDFVVLSVLQYKIYKILFFFAFFSSSRGLGQSRAWARPKPSTTARLKILKSQGRLKPSQSRGFQAKPGRNSTIFNLSQRDYNKIYISAPGSLAHCVKHMFQILGFAVQLSRWNALRCTISILRRRSQVRHSSYQQVRAIFAGETRSWTWFWMISTLCTVL
jgi:hypothetical protein